MSEAHAIFTATPEGTLQILNGAMKKIERDQKICLAVMEETWPNINKGIVSPPFSGGLTGEGWAGRLGKVVLHAFPVFTILLFDRLHLSKVRRLQALYFCRMVRLQTFYCYISLSIKTRIFLNKGRIAAIDLALLLLEPRNRSAVDAVEKPPNPGERSSGRSRGNRDDSDPLG